MARQGTANPRTRVRISPLTLTKTKYMSDKKALTIGQEVMRVEFSGNTEVRVFKEAYAKLFDMLADEAMKAQKAIDTAPAIMSDETIKRHMETIRAGEELMRCVSEANKLIELSCMWAVKGLTA